MSEPRRWRISHISRLVRGACLLALDARTLRRQHPVSSPPQAAFFCLHGLGDLLLGGHALAKLITHARAQKLAPVLFVHPHHIEFARRNFPPAEVHGIDRRRLTHDLPYRAHIIRRLANRFSLAVQPTYNRMLRIEDSLMRATGAAQRIGSSGNPMFILPAERRLTDRLYTRLIPQAASPFHELDRYAEFMDGLQLPISRTPWLVNPEQPTSLPRPTTPYFIVAPDASHPMRSWQRDNFIQTARHIARQRQWTALFIGRAPHGLANEPGILDWGGQTQIEELPGLLGAAKLILCNDSGVFHLGIALGRPTVAVGGGGLPGRYFPYPATLNLRTEIIFRSPPCRGCNWNCIHTRCRTQTAPCMAEIDPQELIAAANRLL